MKPYSASVAVLAVSALVIYVGGCLTFAQNADPAPAAIVAVPPCEGCGASKLGYDPNLPGDKERFDRKMEVHQAAENAKGIEGGKRAMAELLKWQGCEVTVSDHESLAPSATLTEAVRALSNDDRIPIQRARMYAGTLRFLEGLQIVKWNIVLISSSRLPDGSTEFKVSLKPFLVHPQQGMIFVTLDGGLMETWTVSPSGEAACKSVKARWVEACRGQPDFNEEATIDAGPGLVQL